MHTTPLSHSLTLPPFLPPALTPLTQPPTHPPTHPPNTQPITPPHPPPTLSLSDILSFSLSPSLPLAHTHRLRARCIFVISSSSSSVLLNPVIFFLFILSSHHTPHQFYSTLFISFFLGLFIFKLFSYIRHLISLHQVYSTLHWGGSCPVHVSGSWERGRERAGRGGEGEKLQDQER